MRDVKDLGPALLPLLQKKLGKIFWDKNTGCLTGIKISYKDIKNL